MKQGYVNHKHWVWIQTGASDGIIEGWEAMVAPLREGTSLCMGSTGLLLHEEALKDFSLLYYLRDSP